MPIVVLFLLLLPVASMHGCEYNYFLHYFAVNEIEASEGSVVTLSRSDTAKVVYSLQNLVELITGWSVALT